MCDVCTQNWCELKIFSEPRNGVFFVLSLFPLFCIKCGQKSVLYSLVCMKECIIFSFLTNIQGSGQLGISLRPPPFYLCRCFHNKPYDKTRPLKRLLFLQYIFCFPMRVENFRSAEMYYRCYNWQLRLSLAWNFFWVKSRKCLHVVDLVELLWGFIWQVFIIRNGYSIIVPSVPSLLYFRLPSLPFKIVAK